MLLGNDEFCHQRYPCDLQRMWNIVQTLQQTNKFHDGRILYIRSTLFTTLRDLHAATLKDGLHLSYINHDCEQNDFAAVLPDHVLINCETCLNKIILFHQGENYEKKNCRVLGMTSTDDVKQAFMKYITRTLMSCLSGVFVVYGQRAS